MLFHLNKELFGKFIGDMSKEKNIAADIIEKDYYVCLVLKELAKKQDYLKAYFKGGTAVYKMLDAMNRFSEDIDLTVKVLPEQSSTQNRKRLKLSVLGYEIDGLNLEKDECIDNKGSVTAVYKYETVFDLEDMPLQRAGIIQVEATSFTISEPTEKCYIEPLIYKLASEEEKKILEEQFEVSKIPVEVIKLERMFIDKIFAAEFYYIRDMYMDVAKHLYDISMLFGNSKIQKLLDDKEELQKLIQYKRQEEKVRKGGIEERLRYKRFQLLEIRI